MYGKSYGFPLFVLVLFVSLSVFGCSQKMLQQQLEQSQMDLDQCRERVAALNDSMTAIRQDMAENQENISLSTAQRDSLQDRISALQDSLNMAEQRMSEMRENLSAQQRETEAARQSARQQTAQRQTTVRRDITQGRAVVAARSAQIDSLTRVQEALEDSLSACEQRLADMTANQDSLRSAMNTGSAATDNRVRTLSILLVAAAAAFVVSLVWAVVKK